LNVAQLLLPLFRLLLGLSLSALLSAPRKLAAVRPVARLRSTVGDGTDRGEKSAPTGNIDGENAIGAVRAHDTGLRPISTQTRGSSRSSVFSVKGDQRPRCDCGRQRPIRDSTNVGCHGAGEPTVYDLPVSQIGSPFIPRSLSTKPPKSGFPVANGPLFWSNLASSSAHVVLSAPGQPKQSPPAEVKARSPARSFNPSALA
jgi:hypothetical protein